MHTRAMDADADGNVMTEVAIVSTDIEAPKATAFGTVHTLDVRAVEKMRPRRCPTMP